MEEGLSGMVKVKICGLTDVKDAKLLNQYGADYAGVVLFYPQSRRNQPIEAAAEIIRALRPEIKKVAVTVSPDLEQVKLCRLAGFDYIQVHGECREEVLEQKQLPVFRAVNVGERLEAPVEHENIAGYVFDGRLPGNGEVFDWELLKDFRRNGKLLMLAGGLNPQNVTEGIRLLNPDIVDVSSGVENENGIGKNPERVRKFIEEVKKYRKNIMI